MTTLREAALAEPAPEPVAWMYTGIKQDGTEHGPHLVWKPEYMDAMSASKGAKATPLYTAPPQQAEPESCAWHQDGDSESDLYATSCRHYFNLDDGTPEDNKMHWCCYCGKTLAQELITEDGND